MNAKQKEQRQRVKRLAEEKADRLARLAAYREGVESGRLYSPVDMSKTRNPHARNRRERKAQQ